jgi:predicted DsbA family dithiol-disulfide isomerase
MEKGAPPLKTGGLTALGSALGQVLRDCALSCPLLTGGRRPSFDNYHVTSRTRINPMNTSNHSPTSEGVAPSMMIEYFFDFVCPWCLIGKRHLRAAISRLADLRPDVQVRVLWRSHQLLPDIPPGGVPYQPFYIARLGSAEAVAQRRAQVQQAGNPADIQFAFERIEVMPNTMAAHNLSTWAAENGTEAQQAALIENLFTAYFIDGEDIGDPSVLQRRAQACGLEAEGLRKHLAELGEQNGIMHSPQADYVSGVPFFVFNGKYAISGAHPPETLVQAMLQSI